MSSRLHDLRADLGALAGISPTFHDTADSAPRVVAWRQPANVAPRLGGMSVLPPFPTPGLIPLICIPGAGHSAGGFLDLAHALARLGVTVHLVNRRSAGSGDSASICEPARLRQTRAADEVDDLRAVIEFLRREGGLGNNFVLLGHSLGGVFAQLYARRWPVAGLVLLHSALPAQLLAGKAALTAIMRTAPWVLLRVMHDPAVLFSTPTLRRRLLLGDAWTPELDACCRALLGYEPPSLARDVRTWLREGYQTLHTPHILVIGAEEDALLPPPVQRHLVELLHTHNYWEPSTRSTVEYLELPHAPHDSLLIPSHVAAAVGPLADFVARCAQVAHPATAEISPSTERT